MFKKLLPLLFLFAGFQANAAIIGNDVIDRSIVDLASNITFVDPSLSFNEAGVIESWDIFAGRASSEFSLQVFRSTGSTNEFELIGENYFGSAGALGMVNLAVGAPDQIVVQAGDFIGWWFGSGLGVIEFSGGSDIVHWNCGGCSRLSVGGTDFLNPGSAREYSIRANYSAVPEPSIIALFALGLVGIGFARRRQS
jgi:hypothetical protein